MLFTRKNLSVKIHKPADDKDDGSRLYLVRGNDHTGQKAYYFVLLDRARMQQFREAALQQQPFDLKEYGDIVASGYGETVPESLRIRMRVEHGWA